MPWDSAALYVASVGDDGMLARPKRIAGGDGSAVFQPEWGPDGHLYFTWDKTGWGSLYRWTGDKTVRVHGSAGAELWRPQWVFGTRCYALHPDGRFAAISSERGMPLLEIGQLARQTRHGLCARCKATTARIDDPVAAGDGFAALVSSPVATPAVMRLARGGVRPIAETPAGSHRARLRQPRRSARVQECQAADGLRHPLPAGEPAPSRTEGRGAAGPGAGARRPDQHDRRRPEAARAILYQPRVCRVRCQLCRQHRLRPRLPRAPRRPVGHRRRRRLRGRRAPSGEGGARRCGQDRHRRRQRGRLHDADGARHDEGLRGRQQPLRHLRPGAASGAHPQIRVGLSAPPARHHAVEMEGRFCQSAPRSI